MGLANQIFALQQVVEKCRAVRKEVYCVLVNLERAYDIENELRNDLCEYDES